MAQSIKNLPIGAKIYFGRHSVNGETATPITWLVVAKNHYGSNEITLLSENIIDFRCYDAKEPNNTDSYRRDYGNNRYDVSNIHQWLNSIGGGGNWYTPQHSADQSPDSANTMSNTMYSNRPGFLNGFTDEERRSMVQAPIPCGLANIDGGGSVTIYAKVFLPSVRETNANVTSGFVDGTVWEYFNNIPSGDRYSANRIRATQSAISNTLATEKPSHTYIDWYWWTRSPALVNGCFAYYYNEEGNYVYSYGTNDGRVGVRPATNLNGELMVSDTTDSNGVYSIVAVPPKAPTGFKIGYSPTVETTVYLDNYNWIRWETPTTAELEAISHYELEVMTPQRDYFVIDTPDEEAMDMSVMRTMVLLPQGIANEGDTISFRMRAIGKNGLVSEYSDVASATAIYYTDDKVILELDMSQLNGVKTDEFSVAYVVGHTENVYNTKSIEVSVSVDDVVVDTYSFLPEEGKEMRLEKTITIAGEDWLKLENRTHRIYIEVGVIPHNTAVARTGEAYLDVTFIKQVDTLVVGNADAMPSTTKPYRASVNLIYGKPIDAILKVEVCNNGFDINPTWEDMTYAVLSGSAHIFTNTTKTADKWGVKVRASINRNGSVGDCYISSIGGNWE